MTDYAKLKVVELKAELKSRGLLQTGLKQVLIDRLIESDNTPSDDPPAPSPEVSQPTQTETPATIPPQVNGVLQESAPATDSVPASIPTPPVSEVVEDSRKRKRRSHSPPLSTQETSKKIKQVENAAADDAAITAEAFVERVEAVEESDMQDVAQSPETTQEQAIVPETDETELTLPEESTNDGSVLKTVEKSAAKSPQPLAESRKTPLPAKVEEKEEKQATTAEAPQTIVPTSADESAPQQAEQRGPEEQSEQAIEEAKVPPSPQRNRERDARFRGLANADTTNNRTSPPPPSDSPAAPSIHHATPALYIREFSRPLQVPALQRHLIALATPPRRSRSRDRSASRSPPADSTILQKFHISTLRTHVLLLFSSTAAASRVRAALHNAVWPAERMRKPLWADFIPEDKVEAWIEREIESENSARGGGSRVGGKRWEIVYRDSTDGEGMEAVHQEVGLGGSSAPLKRKETSTIPNSNRPKPQAFVALDSLFSSTTTKPKLYYKAMDRDTVDRRMDILKRSSGRPARGDMRRYTFEDRYDLVDGGPERGGPRGAGPEYGGYEGYGRRGGRGGGRGRGYGYGTGNSGIGYGRDRR